MKRIVLGLISMVLFVFGRPALAYPIPLDLKYAQWQGGFTFGVNATDTFGATVPDSNLFDTPYRAISSANSTLAITGVQGLLKPEYRVEGTLDLAEHDLILDAGVGKISGLAASIDITNLSISFGPGLLALVPLDGDVKSLAISFNYSFDAIVHFGTDSFTFSVTGTRPTTSYGDLYGNGPYFPGSIYDGNVNSWMANPIATKTIGDIRYDAYVTVPSFAVLVPEPTTGALVALGLLGLACGRRRMGIALAIPAALALVSVPHPAGAIQTYTDLASWESAAVVFNFDPLDYPDEIIPSLGGQVIAGFVALQVPEHDNQSGLVNGAFVGDVHHACDVGERFCPATNDLILDRAVRAFAFDVVDTESIGIRLQPIGNPGPLGDPIDVQTGDFVGWTAPETFWSVRVTALFDSTSYALDNIRYAEAPEPATSGLLGLGLLALAWRRPRN